MKKFLFFILLLLLPFLYGGTAINPESGGLDITPDVQTEDGATVCYAPDTIKVADGTLTNNGDGTCSMAGGGGTECVSSACDLHVDTELNEQGICLADGTDCPAGLGDSVTVAGTGADTTADFVDDGDIDFTLTDGGAGGPDAIKADIKSDIIIPNNFAFSQDFGDINTDAGGALRYGGDSVDDTHLNWGSMTYLGEEGVSLVREWGYIYLL